MLVEVAGDFQPEVFLVSRQRGGYLGYMLLQAFQATDPDVRLLVNRGWVPRDQGLKYKHQLLSALDDHKVTALLKKGEQLEVKEKQLVFFRSSSEFQIVDLETINQNLSPPVLPHVYLEEFISDEAYSPDLYPVKSNRLTYQMPYLTPQKHLEYSTFWGACAMLGLYGFVRACRIR
jgi:cytochrome oxidase assembly protein ShyY1